MQVRIRTTPGGVLGTMLLAGSVGAVLVLASVDRAGLVQPSVLPTTPPAVSTAATPAPPRTPSATAAAHPTPSIVKAPKGSGLPDGGNYILGFYIPPPGQR